MQSPDPGNDSNLAVEAAFANFTRSWSLGERPDPEVFCQHHLESMPFLRERIGEFLSKWEESETYQLLHRWHHGDRKAFEALIERHYDWLLYAVRRKMQELGPLMRQGGDESADQVQDVLVELLVGMPRFILSDAAAFRKLLLRILENRLIDKLRYQSALKRDRGRLKPLPGDSALYLDPPCSESSSPSGAAARSEQEALVHLALDLVPPEVRQVIYLREWEDLSFAQIGEALGLSADAARMKRNRALVQLARVVGSLRFKRIEEALAEAGCEDQYFE